MSKTVQMAESIEIMASAETIFDYLLDGNNDPKWRIEVDRMDVRGPLRLGTVMLEYSTFYKFLHTVTPTELKVIERPSMIVLETPANHPTWLKSVREIKPTHNGACDVAYELSFSLDSMKQIMPFVPPVSMVDKWYRPRMRKYLRNLKGILEKS